MSPNEAFLSHSSADHVFVSDVANTLTRHSIPIWYSKKSIRGAQEWHREIGAALTRCDWFIIVLSPQSIASMWVKRELIFALQQPYYEDRIVPILYQDCDTTKLSWTLPSFQMVDFRHSVDAGYRELLRIWGVGYIP